MTIELPRELRPDDAERAANARSHVVVGLSGGVDSSVAALILKAQGYRVEAVFMRNWEDDEEHCTARQDYRDAAAVAARLEMPLSTVNFAEEYWERVFEHFLAEYGAGRTPNPDILCNREIKFRAFLDHARGLGAEHIATGHYARRGRSESGRATLLRGLDESKDQSYFLHALAQPQLAAALFPVGALEKTRVRTIAREAGFGVAAKKDSTGICFIGERKFNRFLADYLPARPGDIVDERGEVIGRHSGLMFHTLGQRQGLGIGGRHGAAESPWYVLEKDLESNRLVVGQGHDNPRLLAREVRARSASWVAGRAPATAVDCTAKVRYRQGDVPCRVTLEPDGTLEAVFDEPVRAATPGQSLVLYDGERCLGGAIIESAGRAIRASADGGATFPGDERAGAERPGEGSAGLLYSGR